MPDVIIIGLGPARGKRPPIYLCRANRRALLVGKDFGALQKAEKIENYFGLEEPISGEALAHRGLEQAGRSARRFFSRRRSTSPGSRRASAC